MQLYSPSQMSNPEKFKHLDEEGGHAAETCVQFPRPSRAHLLTLCLFIACRLDPAALRRRYITVAGFIGILVVLVFGIVLATRQGEGAPRTPFFAPFRSAARIHSLAVASYTLL